MSSEQEIIDNAIFYKTNGVGQVNLEQTNEMYVWFNSVWSNVERNLYPQIQKQGESLVEFFPSRFLFGETTSYQQGIADNKLYKHSSGIYAGGCICFTNKSIYFVALQAVTQKYPLFTGGATGLTRAFLETVSGKVNDKEAYKGDNTWTVDYSSILGAQITKPESKSNEIIYIKTASVDWQIHDHSELLGEMLTIIKMGMNGKFSNI